MRVIGFFIALFFIPFVAFAALININTADATLLDTLPGIGATKAQAIIDYRNTNGAFATIADIQNVSGIGPSTYAQIAPLITVESGNEVQSITTPTATTTATTTASGGASSYAPPPTALALALDGPTSAFLEVPVQLLAHVTTKSGAPDSAAQITWSFGDGSASSGPVVEKTYRYPGTYLITAIATDGDTQARAETTIVVAPAQANITAVTSDGITVTNTASDRLDLSGWWLRTGTGMFHIPEGMTILPQASVLFPFVVMNMPVAFSAMLTYPNGIMASQYPLLAASETGETDVSEDVSAPEQPIAPAASYKQGTEVDPIISQSPSVATYEEAVTAPAATPEPVAAGAPTTTTAEAAVAAAPATGLLHSPWTMGFIGLVVLAGGAFILL